VEFSFTINNVEKTVSVEKKGDEYLFALDSGEYKVTASTLTGATLAFFIDNRSCVAVISKNSKGTSIDLDGQTYTLKWAEDEAKPGAGRGSGHGSGTVESPMPGNIVAVHVAEGDEVGAGQAVVVIESMKMQNEIAAPIKGKVARVACSVGDQVNFGEVLVEIEPQD
jgi:acetyl-CoA/propionyl-CoA carboxylase biotin carboxyl carrier protein